MIRRIVEDWDEYSVNWVNRPDVTFENEIYVPNSTDAFQDYEVDVTKMVLDMLLSPEESHGFMIQLWLESYYNRVVFASSDNPNEDFHPRLELQFESLGIREFAGEGLLRVFPNPARDQITIEMWDEHRDAISGAKQLEIIDNTGRTVLSIVNFSKIKNPLDISSLSPGIYWVRLHDDSDNLIGTKKVVLQ
jgi:hypothetical protein